MPKEEGSDCLRVSDQNERDLFIGRNVEIRFSGMSNRAGGALLPQRRKRVVDGLILTRKSLCCSKIETY